MTQRRAFLTLALAGLAAPGLIGPAAAATPEIPVDWDHWNIQGTVRLYERLLAADAEYKVELPWRRAVDFKGPDHVQAVNRAFDQLLGHIMTHFSAAPCTTEMLEMVMGNPLIQVTEEDLMILARGAIPVLVARRVLSIHQIPVRTKLMQHWPAFVSRYAPLLPGARSVA